MAPPFHTSTDDTTSSSANNSNSIYAFPFSGISSGGKTAAAAPSVAPSRPSTSNSAPKNVGTATATTTTTTKSTMKPHYVCSPIPSMVASFNLHRRLYLPTFAIPAMLLTIPPLVIGTLSVLAYFAIQGSGSCSNSLWTIIISSSSIIGTTYMMTKLGFDAISRHAPNEMKRRDALGKSKVAVPFYSLMICIAVSRMMSWVFHSALKVGGSGEDVEEVGGRWMSSGGLLGFVTTFLFWSIKIAGACFGPALAWLVISVLVGLRYAGPFCPTVRCSSTPLQTNPFDAAFQRFGRNFTSKNRFLDMIASGVDKLSALTAADDKSKTKKAVNGAGQPVNGTNQMKAQTATTPQNTAQPSNSLLKYLVSSSTARYSRPGVASMIVQMAVNALGGHVFAYVFILPHLGFYTTMSFDDAALNIIWFSCILVPMGELLSTTKEAELHYKHYALFGGSLQGGVRGFHVWPVILALAKDVAACVKQLMFGFTMLNPMLAPVYSSAMILVASHVCPLFLGNWMLFTVPSHWSVLQSVLVSFVITVLMVFIMGLQQVLSRWAVCAPGIDVDVLMFQSPPTTGKKFLAEDLLVQSIICDGSTVEKVIAPPGLIHKSTNRQEDEISRNEVAAASFAEWIVNHSTTNSGKLGDDLLRICLLESLGGGSAPQPNQPNPFYFGNHRHSTAVKKRLDLSAATTSPGEQQIVVPVARALCAFAGGVGVAMSKIYCSVDKNGKPLRKSRQAELWKLPPGSLNAVEYALVASTRLAVMNCVVDKQGRVDPSKRHSQLSLLLPCVLQSAYMVRRGLFEYARSMAIMHEVDLSTFANDGTNSDELQEFIAAKCKDLSPVISAINDSAKMVVKTLVEFGELEGLLLSRRYPKDMQQFVTDLNQ